MARYDLRLTDGEFLRLTPAQFRALFERRLVDLEEQDSHAALVCTLLANIHRGKNKRPFKIEDFMPQRRGNRTVRREQTWQEQLEMVKKWHVLFGGK